MIFLAGQLRVLEILEPVQLRLQPFVGILQTNWKEKCSGCSALTQMD